MKQTWNNILLVAGSGQNVGKTTFINCALEQTREQKPIAVKISTHFHSVTPGLKLISENLGYQLFEETDRNSNKDSSLFLQHGAVRSFYIQVNDEHLPEAFLALLPFMEAGRPIIIESAALHKHITAGLFLFIYNKDGEKKPHTEANLKVTNLVIHSDGKSFSIPPSNLKFDNEWKINQ